MTALEVATYQAKQALLNAGDADGNAKFARLALEHGNIPRAIEALTLAKQQAETTASMAAMALSTLQTMPQNDRVEGRDAALSRRVPSHDGLCGNGSEVGAGGTAVDIAQAPDIHAELTMAAFHRELAT